MNKKGILGLNTVKAVILALLVLAVLVIAMFAILGPLLTSYEDVDVQTVTKYNESIGTVDSTAYVPVAAYSYRNPICTFTQCLNNTAKSDIVPGENFTNSSCRVTYSGEKDTGGFNGTAWKCSYTATYDSMGPWNIVQNLTIGPSKFFANVPTFFVLLGVVVLILIIAIVIVAVTRFSPGIGIGGTQAGGGALESI